VNILLHVCLINAETITLKYTLLVEKLEFFQRFLSAPRSQF